MQDTKNFSSTMAYNLNQKSPRHKGKGLKNRKNFNKNKQKQ